MFYDFTPTGDLSHDIGVVSEKYPEESLDNIRADILDSYQHFSPFSEQAIKLLNLLRKAKSEEAQNMSICCCFQNQSGFVMASDSRSIRADRFGIVESVDDAFQKIVYLEYAHCAIINAGANVFSGMKFVDFVKEREQTMVSESAHACFDAFVKGVQTTNSKDIASFCFAKSGSRQGALFCDLRGRDYVIADVGFAWHNTPPNIGNSIFDTICGSPFDAAIHQMSLIELADFARAIVNAYKAACEHRRSLQLPASCTPSGYVSPIGGPVRLLAVDSEGRVVVDETNQKKGR